MNLNFGEDFSVENVEYVNSLTKEQLLELFDECEDYITMCDTNQQNRKILINALYGALGNIHFRYYSLQNAAAVTTFGQLAIQWVERKVNEYLNALCGTKNHDYIIAIDTDSIYVDVENVVNKVGVDRFKETNDLIDFLDALGKKKLEPIIDAGYQEMCEYMNNREHLMLMDREAIASKPLNSDGVGAFWKAKKRYALNVYDMEGTRYTTKPKLKIMGLETQSSSTPKAVQDALYESVRIMLQEGEPKLQAFYKKFELEYKKLDYKVIAKVSSANNIAKYDDKGFPGSGCPAHVRGVLAYNRAIKDLPSATIIQEGEKVMVLPLKNGNCVQERVISWPSGSELPIEFREKLLKSVDYVELFGKSFKAPLEGMSDAAGLKFEKRATLEDIFGI